MNKDNANIKIYSTGDGYYKLSIEYQGEDIVHAFYVESIGYGKYEYTIGNIKDSINKDDNLLNIHGFKYIENLKRFCTLGIRDLDHPSTINKSIQHGLLIIVKILIFKYITPVQVEILNGTYVELNKNEK